MTLNRRRLFAAFAGAAGATTPALARESEVPLAATDAVALGLRPNAIDDQTVTFQRAIERAAMLRTVLRLPPGSYRTGALQLPPYAALAGVPGATRIVMAGGPSLFSATGSDRISLRGLVLDGNSVPLPDNRGLMDFSRGRAVYIEDCEILNSGGDGIKLDNVAGEVAGNTIAATADYAIFSHDAAGLRIAANTVRGAGNGGILVWRSKPGDDGTAVVDNRIENIENKLGGDGQWGNAINIFRADNVIVRGNRVRHAAYSAIRGNSASNLQIVGNTCGGLGEVALYSEFSFEGAVIANNIVDGAAVGVAVTNFNEGGRLAVVQGNIVRNLKRGYKSARDPNGTAAVGISIEADTAVSGNVVENVPGTGIQAGFGPYLRDVTITGNVVRSADIGIGVSVAPGAGAAVIADNLIAGARMGAVLGMEWQNPVSGDLSKDGSQRYAQLSIAGNRVR
jgi:uncharacterized secreted repeat protein (TIGR03808 family)